MRNPLRVLALLMLVCLSPSALAAETCVTQKDIARKAIAQMPRASVTTTEGEEAERFLAAYNQFPPATNLSGEAVMIIDAGPATPSVFAVLFKDGCATAGGRISRRTYEAVLARLARNGA